MDHTLAPATAPTISRVVLWLLGLSFAGFGLWALAMPYAFASAIGFELSNAAALTEMRAFYGGLELGLGIFFVLCAVRPNLVRAGLTLGVVALASVASTRLLGLIMDNSWNALMLGVLASEVLGIIACLWALRAR